MAHVFRFFLPADAGVESDARVKLAPDDAKRLHKVLRLSVGEKIEIADGTGRVFEGNVADPMGGDVIIGEELSEQAALVPIRILLAQSGPRADDAVEKLVELGVQSIGPLQAEGRRRDARTDRWERIAAGAAAQAKLPDVPAIVDPVALQDAFVPGAIFCSHEEAGEPFEAVLSQAGSPVTLLIGPESGFTPEEHAAARAAGVPIASLGPTVLRTETAAIVAATLARSALGR